MEQQLEVSHTETYLSATDVTKMLRINRSTLWRWAQSQYLVPIKIGGKIRYKRSDIDQIINAKNLD